MLAGHRVPAEIISHAVWLSHRFHAVLQRTLKQEQDAVQELESAAKRLGQQAATA